MGLTGGRAGNVSEFHIQACTVKGQPKKKGGEEFKVMISGPEFKEAQVTDLRDGKYLVQYQLSIRGLYDMYIGLRGIQIAGSPFSLIISASLI
jgi:hypothetical protein